MKWLLNLILSLSLFIPFCIAADLGSDAKESKQGVISVTATAAATDIGKAHLIVINDGSKTAYIRLNSTSAATVSDIPIVATRSVTFDCSVGSQIRKIGYICAGTDSTSLSYIAWD